MARRLRVLGWAVIAATPILVLGALEMAARLFDLRPAGGPEAALPAWLDRNIQVKEGRWAELLSGSPRDLTNYYKTYLWDRYLFYRLAPGLDLPLTDVTAPPEIRERTRWIFHTNGRGFNAREVSYAKPAGAIRIVALGDSSTFGWGVESSLAYPHVLEEVLRRRHPGLRIEVVNLGVCGYSTLQGRVLLQREGTRYEPDVVILSYGSNDYSRVPESFDEAYERNLGWLGAIRGVLIHSRAYQVYASYLMRAVGSRASAGEPGQAAGVLNVGPQKSRDNLVAMVRTTRDGGADPILVTNCVPGEMSEPIRAAAVETSTPILDTAQLLEAAVPDLMAGRAFQKEMLHLRGLYGAAMMEEHPWLSVYLTDRCHPNPIGHRLIAETLATKAEATRAFAAAASQRPHSSSGVPP